MDHSKAEFQGAVELGLDDNRYRTKWASIAYESRLEGNQISNQHSGKFESGLVKKVKNVETNPIYHINKFLSLGPAEISNHHDLIVVRED